MPVKIAQTGGELLVAFENMAGIIEDALASGMGELRYLRDYDDVGTDPYRKRPVAGGLTDFVTTYFKSQHLDVFPNNIQIYALDIGVLGLIRDALQSVAGGGSGPPPVLVDSRSSNQISPFVVFIDQRRIQLETQQTVIWPNRRVPLPTIMVVTLRNVLNPAAGNYDPRLDRLAQDGILAHEFTHLAQWLSPQHTGVQQIPVLDSAGRDTGNELSAPMAQVPHQTRNPITGRPVQDNMHKMLEDEADQVMFVDFLKNHEGVSFENCGKILTALEQNGLLVGGGVAHKLEDYREALYRAYGKRGLKTLIDRYRTPQGLAVNGVTVQDYANRAATVARSHGLPIGSQRGVTFYVDGKQETCVISFLIPAKGPGQLRADEQAAMQEVTAGTRDPADAGGLFLQYNGEYPLITLVVEVTNQLQWAMSTAVHRLGLGNVADQWVALINASAGRLPDVEVEQVDNGVEVPRDNQMVKRRMR